ncbi:MAG: MFS transporter, partial [Quisquiliibacterium sp.]
MSSQFLSGALALRVFACFGAAYFMSYALRSVNAVIAPDLVGEFGLSNSQLGALSSAYFFSFALLQLPLGVSLDRFGSRPTHASLLLVAAAGCATFALAQDFVALWIGRALVGAGVAGALMAALKGYRFWYPAERQQQLAAWMLVVGTGGALAVTLPVQLLVEQIGWRGVFWVAAGLMLLCAAAIWTLVPRDEEQQVHPAEPGSIWSGYLEVFRDRYFWRFAPAAMVVQGTFISMQSLWAGPWFRRVLGMSAVESANALFVFNLVLLCAYIGLGAALPALSRAGWSTFRIVSVSTVFVLVLQAWIGLADAALAWMLWLPFAVLSTGYIVLQPHVCTTFPPALTGRAYT